MMSSLFMRRASAWTLAFIASCLLIGLYVQVGQETIKDKASSDFYKFYLTGERMRQGKGMYWIAPARMAASDPCYRDAYRKNNQAPPNPAELGGEWPCLHPNLNPPIFTLFAIPFSLLPYETAWWSWAGTSILFALISVWLLVKIFTKQKTNVPLNFSAASIAFFSYFPTFCSFKYGQVTMLIMLPITLAWISMRDMKDFKAGLWLGLATSLKPFIIIYFLPLAIAKRWGILTYSILTIFALAFIGLSIFGWNSHQEYLRIANDVTWTTSNWNASISGFFSRLMGGAENPPWINSPISAKILTIAFSTIVIAAIRQSLMRTEHLPHQIRTDALFSLALPTVLLLSPLGWIYYFPLLAMSATLLWRSISEIPKKRIWRLLFLLTICPTLIPTALRQSYEMSGPSDWLWMGALYTYSLSVYLFLLITSLGRLSFFKSN